MYDRQVSEKLGEDAVKEILKDTERGLITPQQMKDIAKRLGPPDKILGNHKRRGKVGADEMREILSDWCLLSDSFYDLSSEGALRLLIRIFKEDPVSLKPLARRLEKLLPDWIPASNTSEQSHPVNLSSPNQSQRVFLPAKPSIPLPSPVMPHQRHQSSEPETPEIKPGGRTPFPHPDSTTSYATLMQSPGPDLR